MDRKNFFIKNYNTGEYILDKDRNNTIKQRTVTPAIPHVHPIQLADTNNVSLDEDEEQVIFDYDDLEIVVLDERIVRQQEKDTNEEGEQHHHNGDVSIIIETGINVPIVPLTSLSIMVGMSIPPSLIQRI